MQFLQFSSLLRKLGLLYAIFGISFTSRKIRTIICNLWNIFPFSQNVDYHMQFQDFLSLLQNHGLSYAIFGISFSSLKTWTIICNFRNFYPFSKKWTIIYNL